MKRVTVVGSGKYGSMTALRIAEYDIVDSVVMTDIVDGLPQGLALDTVSYTHLTLPTIYSV